ncbi:ATP-binding protein [uncultured Metabacillus sp.]|uniref:ATP-binding protein n=1 Tax=uncultured Metabacillus sp. TaxID=2860135 RepID=UPI00345DC9A5
MAVFLINKIFEEHPDGYYALDSKPFFTTKENGTGLGFMVSYEIIKHHNGEVKIDSHSKGTTISVILPISNDDKKKSLGLHL